MVMDEKDPLRGKSSLDNGNNNDNADMDDKITKSIEHLVDETTREINEDYQHASANISNDKNVTNDKVKEEYNDIEEEVVDSVKKPSKPGAVRLKLIITALAAAAIVIIIAFTLAHNNSYSNFYNKAVSSYNNADYNSAIEFLEKAENTKEGANNLDVLEYKADSYAKLNNYDSALATYNRVLQIDPNYGKAVAGICEIYKQRRNVTELRAMIDKYRNTNIASFVEPYITKSPVFSPEQGTLEEDTNVTITSDSNTPIYYTLDGSEPDTNSNLYTKAIKLEEGTTQIKAICISDYGIKSNVVMATYSLKFKEPEAPNISLASGVYITGQTLNITADPGTTIYYTIDGSRPTKDSSKYSNPLKLVSGRVIISAIAINDKSGKVSAVASKSYVVVSNQEELEKAKNNR